MSEGNASNNPFALKKTDEPKSTSGGFFVSPIAWGQKVSEPTATSQQNDPAKTTIFKSFASETQPLLRPSIFEQTATSKNAQTIFGKPLENPTPSLLTSDNSERVTQAGSIGLQQTRTESSSIFAAGRTFGHLEKPGLFSTDKEANPKANADLPSIFGESSSVDPPRFGTVSGGGIFSKALGSEVSNQKKGASIFGGTQSKTAAPISSGFFGKSLHSTSDEPKGNETFLAERQEDSQRFGSFFARPQDSNKPRETIFGNKQDPPSIFGHSNIFEKAQKAHSINVQNTETNIFQRDTDRSAPKIFGMASGSNVQNEEIGNAGERQMDASSRAINPFKGVIKPGHEEGELRPHPRDPRTIIPGIFSHALGDVLKEAPKKFDTTASASSAEIQTLLSLYISDVPKEIFDKALLSKHFSQFGTVTKVLLSNARKSCSVKFEDHESAERAKTQGAQIGNIRLHIFWAKAGSLGHGERRSLKVYHKDGESRSKVQRERQQPKSDAQSSVKQWGSTNLNLYDVEDDVQAELNAMLLPNTSSFSSKLPPAPKPKENRASKMVPRAVSTLSRSKRRSSPLSLREAAATKPVADEGVPLSISNATLDELTKVMRSQAHSAEERYRVLEARDKMMRMKRVRQSNLAKARINRGTCPDMCPEKERYHREFQRQVAVYETSGTPGKMDHSSAIKQYSRSSADQEEPLSHELRPASALRLTMDYLMWKLMDICDKKDESMADWYHYIWDRTRGIRKDITQQELSDESSVELVEQCARWHIFCSERLIAEDLSIYDDNINTENLTKCLQTLKYMYLDLSLKGTACPNEAEFRAYFVMLNLNEGDCMWEVQQLSSEIRESEPVRFALQVSMALASNNYIRFFKLVRSTTYLNACILHRYFAQVRTQALQTMVKAFCSRAKETVFTLEEVVRLAGLENTQEAATLCSQHGLKLSDDKTSVVFSRSKFYLPDTALPACRVISLVDAKRTCSFGAVVSGGSQPRTDFQARVPHNSFDANGVLKLSAWAAQDQEVGGGLDVAAEESEIAVDFAGGEREDQRDEGEILSLLDEEVEDDIEQGVDLMKEAIMRQFVENKCEQTVNELLETVVNDEVCMIVETEMKNAFIDEATEDFANDIINSVTEKMVSTICTEEVNAAITAKEEELRQKRIEAEAEMLRKMREKRFLQELNSYLDEFSRECLEQVMAEENELEDWLVKSTDDIVENFVKEECHLLVKECVDAARLEEVNAIFKRSQKRQLKQYLKRWQDFVVKSKMRKQSMADFPAWMCNLSLEEQASSLSQPDPYLIANMNRVRFATNKSKLRDLEREPPPIPKLDVATAVSVPFSTRMKEVDCHDAFLYWKLLTSGPDSREAPRNSAIIKGWTDQIFSLDDETSMRLSRVSPNSYETLTVCVRSLTGHVENGNASQGTDGILFWLSHKETSFVDARRRLSRLLDTIRKVPAIPVAVVTTGAMPISVKEIHKELGLVLLREELKVSYFKVFPRTGNSASGLRKQVEAACQFLAEVASPPAPVVVVWMRQLMSRCLVDDLWGLVKPTRRTQDPNTMIDLYNRALHQVKGMLCDDSLSDYSLGAQEFKKYVLGDSQHEQRQFHIAPTYWGSQEYYAFVSKVLSKAEIPMMESWPPANNADLKEMILQYCDSQGISHIVSSLFQLIEQQVKIHQRLSYPPAGPTDWKSFLKSISWCDVVETIVEAKLAALDYNFLAADSFELQVVVSLQSFKALETWLIKHLYILDLAESTPEVCHKEEKISQKRSLEDELPQPSKQRKLSLVEIYSNIKASLNRLDMTMSSVKTTWQDVDNEIAK